MFVTYMYTCMFQQVWVYEWCLNSHTLKHICGQHRLHARQGLVDISVARDLVLFSGRDLFAALPNTAILKAAVHLWLPLSKCTETDLNKAVLSIGHGDHSAMGQLSAQLHRPFTCDQAQE